MCAGLADALAIPDLNLDLEAALVVLHGQIRLTTAVVDHPDVVEGHTDPSGVVDLFPPVQRGL